MGTSVSLRVTQQSGRYERVILTGSVWGIDDGLPGLEYRVTEIPVVRESTTSAPDAKVTKGVWPHL